MNNIRTIDAYAVVRDNRLRFEHVQNDTDAVFTNPAVGTNLLTYDAVNYGTGILPTLW